MKHCWTCRWSGLAAYLKAGGLCGSCGASDVHDTPPQPDKPTDRIRAVAPKITIEGVATELNGELRDGCWWFKDSATAQEFGRRTGAATFMNTGACDA